MFAVAVLHWREEIKHVGVCRDVQQPARDSDSGSIAIAEKEFTCKLLSFASVCPYVQDSHTQSVYMCAIPLYVTFYKIHMRVTVA